MITELTISEVARQAGIRTSAIRYYESVGLLAVGFSVSEMQALFHELDRVAPLSARWQSLAKRKLAEVDTLIQRAQNMKQMLEQSLHCSCPDLEQCIDCVLKIHCKDQLEP